MGVHGLWKLLEPSGQMVPLESLAGKVLAVDISIWLHQAVKGMHDAHGAPLAVAHLLVLFHRLCKLLFYKIKPVFVFDGGVPSLKSQTMAARRQRSSVAKTEALKVREKLIKNLLKHEAVRQVLSNETASAALGLNSFTLPGPSVEEDLYKLPPIAADYDDSECSEGTTPSDGEDDKPFEDIHSVDVTSQEFLRLPAEVRHDILTELIETRKQSSWKSLDTMPKQSDSFSDFQMNRLLRRHAVQTSLEKAGKEMGGRALSLKELESLLGDQGVLDPKMELPSRRIAQDSTTRYMLVQREAEEGAKGEFDIMEHLEEVEWSSESDTDVILEQRLERRRKKPVAEEGVSEEKKKAIAEEEVSEEKQKATAEEELSEEAEVAEEGLSEEKQKATAEEEVSEEKQKATALERVLKENQKPTAEEGMSEPKKDSPVKIEMSKEVADILSVLEDEDVTTEVKAKVDDVQCKINQDITSEERVPEEGLAENSAEPAETTGSTISANENPFPPETVPADLDGVEKTDEKVADNITEMADSSSDSESDFIPIVAEDVKNMAPQQEPTQQMADVATDSLTVVIDPSKMSQKDDLFADVFADAQPTQDAPADDLQWTQQASAEDLTKALREERHQLANEQGKQERHALNLTDQIYTDAQELLRLFGVPFVVAPMEAEAQCATLDVLGLTEGTITDDSDIWLFGGRVVYKNFFNQNKHVLEYRSENIERNFKLTREELIKMALLVGSDYTVGLSGIGPVTALEIMAAFQTPNRGGPLESLHKFREWFLGAGKTGPPRTGLRKKIKNTLMTPGFPSRAVVEAYLHPQVDDSKEPFSWAKPNLDLIQKYARAKMGWSEEKCNDMLLPVLKKLEEKTGQTTIDRHFGLVVRKPSAMEGMLSRRVENAVKRLGNGAVAEEEAPDGERPRKKRKGNSGGRRQQQRQGEEGPSGGDEKRASGTGSDLEGKLRLLKAKLHRNVTVPQREMAAKLSEEKKKEAIRIFRTYGKAGKKKRKVFAREEANLSESSSSGREND